MSGLSLLALLGVTALLAAILTECLRAYALAHRVLDVPNARSSHQVPTPRGGGLAIVASFLASLGGLWAVGHIPGSTTLALIGASLIVGMVGFIDDHLPIAVRWRFLAHFSAASWVLYWIGTPRLDWPGGALDLGIVGWVLCVFYLVWLLNLYNFMDGIDGIAAIEAVTVTLPGAALSFVLAIPTAGSAVLTALVVAAAALGFLVWNFPPARIFMGDAGSSFLGIVIGTLSLMAGHDAPVLFWCWVILLGVFVVDATVTLFRRLARRQTLYEAHCSHAYQFASRRVGAHKPVTLAVGLINLGWLLPIAGAVAIGAISGVVGTLIAYTPLVVLAYYLKAGAAEQQVT